MKKLVMGLIVLVSVSAFAQKKDSNMVVGADTLDGCGLGWQVTQDRTMLATTTRGSTNYFVPPAFGMTSGTIGCEQIGFAANDKQAATFVASNYQNLKSELAVGQGEYVTAMVESFGCPASATPAISAKIQNNYQTVVAPTKNATELFNNLKTEVGQCG